MAHRFNGPERNIRSHLGQVMSGDSKHFNVHRYDDVVAIRLTVEVVDHANGEQFANEIQSLVDDEGIKKLIIDMSKLDYLHSLALGLLKKLDSQLKASGGQLCLCDVQPTVYELLTITHLSSVIDVQLNMSAALRAMQSK